ncbi:uncharacterized protein BBOV_IV008624 [Babesia bovis T2Bo]|uniref:uncharacterized protein n=1 Tax=Babesia bovis T2Bo TaxID=484906 RepID=UPI001DDD5601|nr:uncharacterized protein BBOV_IV008624 [Babesia bovis T2Bo]KAG6439970.1 hypothetical protein BBOV_IV008624 [Babesia bovis T2Bo]
MANLAAFLMAIFAMGSAVYAIDDILEELNDTKTAESRIIAQALETLQNEHEFSEKTIRSAYEICKEENEESRVSCLINALHVQKLLEDHSFHICTFQFLVSVLVECSVDCFDYYNVRCFKCIGKPIPTFIKCMKTGPPEYV